ncbi:MAG: ribonuclease Y [Puniceicoccales bacterium]|jgi:ribonuclease Y|nr:ribonuclease Y [Puniceicoccales bacterium]
MDYDSLKDFDITTSHILALAIGAFAAFLLGGVIVFVINRFREHYLTKTLEEKYQQLLELGKKENEIHAMELRAKVEEDFRGREEEIRKTTGAIESLQSETTRIHDEIMVRSEKLRTMEEENERERKQLESDRVRYRQEMLRVANMSYAEARRGAIDAVYKECETEVSQLRQEILGRREEEIRSESRRILVDTMQRLAPAITHETNGAIVSIPSEDMKGRLIGREGRNIKTFEQVTGTTLLIDETPDSVLVSSFDPVRREIARLALQNLIRDGRIHPTNIEDFVERAREQVITNAIDLGRAAVEKLNLPPMEPTITELLGRLHFRLSINQNTLEHSIEVAHIAAMIASELGIDPIPAKRAGLLHDIGKAIDAEQEGSHALVGARVLKQHAEDARVVNAVAAHHREADPTSVYAPIIVLADTISATRPGARSSTMEGYVERVRNLETIAKSYPGVLEAYAVMAGREVRVIVAPDKLSEEAARDTVFRIRTQIEDEMQYPGSIRITLIREQRFFEEAK